MVRRNLFLSLFICISGCATKNIQDQEGSESEQGEQESSQEEESSDEQGKADEEAPTEAAQDQSPGMQETTSAPSESQGANGEGGFEAMLKSMGGQTAAAPVHVPTPAPAPATIPPAASNAGAPTMVSNVPPQATPVSSQKVSKKITQVKIQKSAPKWVEKKTKDPRSDKVVKSTSTAKFVKKMKLKSSVLAVREAPNLQSRIVDHLHGDATVAVISENSDGWSQIGTKRFVRTKYLTSGKQKTVGDGRDVYTVKSEALYIRNAPNSEATVVGVLTIGDKLRGNPANGIWVQIGPKSFVNKKHLETVGH